MCEQSYPSGELHWLAITAFNQAVDFHCSFNDSECKRWAGKSLVIAGWSREGTALQVLLRKKLEAMKCKQT